MRGYREVLRAIKGCYASLWTPHALTYRRELGLADIASCTKAFTTAALAILADQGKLDWDTPVRAYIPGFHLYDPFATERVTPRDLVTHRTGLPRHDLARCNNTTATRRDLFERLMGLEETPWSERFLKEHRGFKDAQEQREKHLCRAT